jgi:hypothetical protein
LDCAQSRAELSPDLKGKTEVRELTPQAMWEICGKSARSGACTAIISKRKTQHLQGFS